MNITPVIGIILVIVSALMCWLPKLRRIIIRFMDKHLTYHTGPCENRCDVCRESLHQATLIIVHLSVLILVLAVLRGC